MLIYILLTLIIISIIILSLIAGGVIKLKCKKKKTEKKVTFSKDPIQSKNELTSKNIDIPSNSARFLSEEARTIANNFQERLPENVKKVWTENFIAPAIYKTGLMDGFTPYCSSDNCNPNKLYPIQQLGPEYGSKVNPDCPCTEFVRAP